MSKMFVGGERKSVASKLVATMTHFSEQVDRTDPIQPKADPNRVKGQATAMTTHENPMPRVHMIPNHMVRHHVPDLVARRRGHSAVEIVWDIYVD